jgi:Na+-transporting NADH:ubiquinone oxidoreductase subunit C
LKNSYLYTVVFMFLVSAFFTGALALTNEASLEKIEVNRVYIEKKAVLDSLDIEYKDDPRSVEDVFNSSIREVEMEGYMIYGMIGDSGGLTAYSVGFNGAGLWGTILGYIAVDSAFEKLIGIEFTAQNETPGLGGRITEDWFKDQFRNIDLVKEFPISFGEGIDAITGATSSSNAVLRILNSFIEEDLPKLEVIR